MTQLSKFAYREFKIVSNNNKLMTNILFIAPELIYKSVIDNIVDKAGFGSRLV